MVSNLDPQRLRDRLSQVTDDLPVRGIGVAEIAERARRRQRARTLAAAGASAVAVVGVVIGFSVTGGPSNPERRPPPPVSGQSASPGPSETPGLPPLTLPPPPVPDTFVAVRRNAVAVFDSATGEMVRSLTPEMDVLRYRSPRIVRSSEESRVWFNHQVGSGTCGGTQIDSVRLTGGSQRTEIQGPAGGAGISVFTTNETGEVVAYELRSCPIPRHAPNYLVARTADGTEGRIELSPNQWIADLTIGGGQLAFIVSDDSHRATLYSVSLRDVTPGDITLAAAEQAEPLPRGCSWDHLAWSRIGLLATQTCQNLDPNGWPTSLYALDAQSLQPTHQGPTIAHDLGINSMSSDAAGHLLVWLSGGDSSGSITEWTSDGERLLRTPICTSADDDPPPCLRTPAW